jgi:hypothetical protein
LTSPRRQMPQYIASPPSELQLSRVVLVRGFCTTA